MIQELYELLKNIFDSYEGNIVVGSLITGGIIAHFEIENISLQNGKLSIEEFDFGDTLIIGTINNFSQGLGCIDIDLPNGGLSIIYE